MHASGAPPGVYPLVTRPDVRAAGNVSLTEQRLPDPAEARKLLSIKYEELASIRNVYVGMDVHKESVKYRVQLIEAREYPAEAPGETGGL